MLEATKKGKTFLTVISDGRLHRKVDAGTEGAVLREGTLKNGETFSKWEKIYDSIDGKITNVSVRDGNFGKSLEIEMNDIGEEFVVSFNVETRFAEDVLHKILSVDMSKDVKITPYPAFKGSDGKDVGEGVNIVQDGKKLKSVFKVYDTGTGKFTDVAGFPEFPKTVGGKKPSTDDYKIYNMQARKFMLEKIEERFGASQSVATEQDDVPTPTTDEEWPF